MTTKYLAAVAIPQSHRVDTDCISSVWRNIGYFSSRQSATNACLRFIQSLNDTLPPELAEEATFYVTSIGRLKDKPYFVQKLIHRNPPTTRKGA